MITRPYQRSAFHKIEAFFQAYGFVFCKNLGSDEFCNVDVHFGGLQVLSNGEYVAAMSNQIIHGFVHFFLSFAEADHDAGFGPFAKGFGARDLLQTSAVFGLRTHEPVQPFYGFHIVGNDFLAGIDHDFQGFPVGLDVWNEGFYGGFGTEFFGEFHGVVPDRSTLVFQLISVDRSDDGVFYLHQFDGFGNTAWFVGIVFIGSTGFHRTKRTRARTDISQNHKSGRASTPTFTHVWAIAALTDGVQFIFIHQTAHAAIVFTNGQLDPEPVRFFGSFWFLDCDV